MAKTRTPKKKSRKDASKSGSALTPELAPVLLQEATAHLQSGQAEEALRVATKALKCLDHPNLDPIASLPALELVGEIYVELGDADAARKVFAQAADLDPNASIPASSGGGADKFLWLAQLSEKGGADSVKWFEKGCAVLRREIAEEEGGAGNEEDEEIIDMKKQKLANALCGVAEVYMTDLSWEDDAEAKCEALVTEACLVAPQSPEPLQTLASVRISQLRVDDARSALTRSLELWADLPADDPAIPDFPTRISLARLLMESELEEKALEVLERLIAEDDSSVEAWYLGGWCLHLIAERQRKSNDAEAAHDAPKPSGPEPTSALKSSRSWLLRSLKLYELVDYEDDRLKAHANELVDQMNKILGPPPKEDPNNPQEEDDDWEDDEDEGEDTGDDEAMDGV